MTKELPEWKRKALADPNLPQKQVEVLLHGPKCLTDAWFLQAMRYKYQIRGYENQQCEGEGKKLTKVGAKDVDRDA